MKFGDRLFQMARRGEAFLHRHGDKSLVLVPFGPYAGTWEYNKSSKRIRWADRSPVYLEPKTEIGRNGKSVVFPLPREVYHLHGSKHAGKLHAASRKSLGYAAFRWKEFERRNLAQFREIIKAAGIHPTHEYKSYHGFITACAYNMPEALRALSENRAAALLKFRDINAHSALLRGFSPARRARFVNRILQHSLQFALAKTFKSTSQEVLNFYLSKTQQDKQSRLYISDLDYTLVGQYLQSNNGAVSYEAYYSLHTYAKYASGGRSLRAMSVKVWTE